jgi:hypothetical protein
MSVAAFIITSNKAHAAMSKFIFKIKTKTGGIIGNILIEAKDQYAAIAILKKRYPDCEILEAKQK